MFRRVMKLSPTLFHAAAWFPARALFSYEDPRISLDVELRSPGTETPTLGSLRAAIAPRCHLPRSYRDLLLTREGLFLDEHDVTATRVERSPLYPQCHAFVLTTSWDELLGDLWIPLSVPSSLYRPEGGEEQFDAFAFFGPSRRARGESLLHHLHLSRGVGALKGVLRYEAQ
jgi:hypothetical protein